MLARKFEKYLIFVSDAVSFNLAFALIFWMRYRSSLFPDSLDLERQFGHFSRLAFALSLIWIAYFFISGLYRDWYLQSRAVQLGMVSKEITTGCLIILAVTTGSDVLEQIQQHRLAHVFTWSRAATFLSYWGTFLVSVNGFRMLVQSLVRRLLRKGIGLDRVLILGATDAGAGIQRELVRVPEMGWKLAGYVDENQAHKGREFEGVPVLGKYADLPTLIPGHKIGGIIISHESASHNEILRVLSHVAEFPLSIHRARSVRRGQRAFQDQRRARHHPQAAFPRAYARLGGQAQAPDGHGHRRPGAGAGGPFDGAYGLAHPDRFPRTRVPIARSASGNTGSASWCISSAPCGPTPRRPARNGPRRAMPG